MSGVKCCTHHATDSRTLQLHEWPISYERLPSHPPPPPEKAHLAATVPSRLPAPMQCNLHLKTLMQEPSYLAATLLPPPTPNKSPQPPQRALTPLMPQSTAFAWSASQAGGQLDGAGGCQPLQARMISCVANKLQKQWLADSRECLHPA